MHPNLDAPIPQLGTYHTPPALRAPPLVLAFSSAHVPGQQEDEEDDEEDEEMEEITEGGSDQGDDDGGGGGCGGDDDDNDQNDANKPPRHGHVIYSLDNDK